jgi:hypothetical protein
MRLPVPNASEVEEFQRLYSAAFNVNLTSGEAQATAMRLVQLVCLLNDAIFPLCKEEQ